MLHLSLTLALVELVLDVLLSYMCVRDNLHFILFKKKNKKIDLYSKIQTDINVEYGYNSQGWTIAIAVISNPLLLLAQGVAVAAAAAAVAVFLVAAVFFPSNRPEIHREHERLIALDSNLGIIELGPAERTALGTA